jgi:DNA-binding transcriptional LysR family regulator
MSFPIDLFDLRLFIHVAETRSLTRGADRACISLGAASTRVKNMEQSIGVRLLNRTASGMVMTAAGEAVLAHARQIHAQMERLRTDLQEYRQGTRGRIRIQADTSAVTPSAPDGLAEFLGRHAEVGIELKESLSEDAVRAVNEGQADIGVVTGDTETAALTSRPFGVSRLMLLVSARCALARQTEISFAEALRSPQVGLHEDSSLHRFLARRAEQAGGSFHPRLHVSGFETMFRMVGNGLGVAVVPRCSALLQSHALDVMCVPMTDPWATRELRLIMRAPGELNALTHKLFQHLADAVQRQPSPQLVPQPLRSVMERVAGADHAGAIAALPVRASRTGLVFEERRERSQ